MCKLMDSIARWHFPYLNDKLYTFCRYWLSYNIDWTVVDLVRCWTFIAPNWSLRLFLSRGVVLYYIVFFVSCVNSLMYSILYVLTLRIIKAYKGNIHIEVYSCLNEWLVRCRTESEKMTSTTLDILVELRVMEARLTDSDQRTAGVCVCVYEGCVIVFWVHV